MNRRVRGALFGLAFAYLLATSVVPLSRSHRERLAVLAVAAVAMVLARTSLGNGSRPTVVWDDPVRGTGGAAEPDVLMARADTALQLAARDAVQFDRTARPRLRRLATERLRSHHGIDVTAEPARARAVMGEELWQIFVRPPADGGPGPGPERLAALVAAVERL